MEGNPFESPAVNEASLYGPSGGVTKTLKYIHPLQAGKVLGALYLLLGLIVAPFMAIAGIVSGDAGAAGAAIGMALLVLVMYTVGGFLGGILMAFLYNVVSKMSGGLRFDFE